MRTARRVLMDAATVVVVLCTVALTGMSISRRFSGPPAGEARGPLPPVFIEEWEEVAAVGHRMGPDTAAVTLVVFSDFECPMCATFASKTYRSLSERNPGKTAMVFRHWPLTKHRFAYPAARAAECAGDQGKFGEFHDLLFAGQQQLGLKTFSHFAAEAGVPDLETFDECASDGEPVHAIERDLVEVRKLGGTGTPTVIVNGWLLRGGVSPHLLDSISFQFLSPSTSILSR